MRQHVACVQPVVGKFVISPVIGCYFQIDEPVVLRSSYLLIRNISMLFSERLCNNKNVK